MKANHPPHHGHRQRLWERFRNTVWQGLLIMKCLNSC